MQQLGQKAADYVACVRKQQLEAKLAPDNFGPSLWAVVPTATKEYLSLPRAYQGHVGPLTEEPCFQDVLLVARQVEESVEDRKHAQQMQQGRERTGNSCSGAGKNKDLLA